MGAKSENFSDTEHQPTEAQNQLNAVNKRLDDVEEKVKEIYDKVNNLDWVGEEKIGQVLDAAKFALDHAGNSTVIILTFLGILFTVFSIIFSVLLHQISSTSKKEDENIRNMIENGLMDEDSSMRKKILKSIMNSDAFKVSVLKTVARAKEGKLEDSDSEEYRKISEKFNE